MTISNDNVKRIAIRAMFSDDGLMRHLVLKGGNAIELVYEISSRASLDLGFSIPGTLGDIQALHERVERLLKKEFRESGYIAFEVTAKEVPKPVVPTNYEVDSFWGGYKMSFKLISFDRYRELKGDPDLIRRYAEAIGANRSTRFEIEISKFEYCDGKVSREYEDLQIFVYSPEMIVAEKLRAICQQMKEYQSIVGKASDRGHAQARDFFDIVNVAEKEGVDFQAPSFSQTLQRVFAAKRVPLSLLGKLEDYRSLHEGDFPSVKATVKPTVAIHEFDRYFDWVKERVKSLESLWNV